MKTSGIGVLITPGKILKQPKTSPPLFLPVCVFLVLLHSLISFQDNVYAWSDNPNVNTPICTASNNQYSPTITSDGAGGAIITWLDYRSGSNYDIYAQRIDASGAIQWSPNGEAICSPSNYPTITSDGAGGAIIAWEDYRWGSNHDIYAQRIDASGTSLWYEYGEAICTASDYQWTPRIISDGSGGAIIAWRDDRNGNPDIYAQRINASGAIQWTPNGEAICTESDDQWNPRIIIDGAGGAIITWQDYRNGYSDIYAQRIYSNGTLGETPDREEANALPWLLLLLDE
jgi:hypothetical protein